jgi:hypothetical protein
MDRNALLEHFRKSRADFLAAIGGLSDAQLEEETHNGWAVKHHMLHLAAWDDIRAQEVERISAGHASLWKMTGEQDAEINAMFDSLRKPATLAQARWEFEQSRAKLLAAIESATERAFDTSLYGEAPVHSGHEAEHTGWIREWRRGRGY